MLNYTLRRLGYALPLLLLISLIIFVLVDLAPGDPTGQLPLSIPADQRERLREGLGMDAPLWLRYLLWCKQFFVTEPLNLLEHWIGADQSAPNRLAMISWSTRLPVADLIAQRLPQTLWVVGLAYVLAIIIAVPLGLASARKPGGWVDRGVTLLSMLGISLPSFFIGTLLIYAFSYKLGLLPSSYNTTLHVTDLESLGAQVRQLVMPVTVLAIYNIALFTRYLRAALLDNLNRPHVRTARAKGLSNRQVMRRHVLPSALPALITIVALGAPNVIGGAIVTEQLFGVNGLGHLLVQGITAGDVPLVQTLAFVFAILVILANLIADIGHGLIDPRVRHDW